MKIFISYSRQDQELVLNLYNFLTRYGYIVWLDQTDLSIGNWVEQIDKALDECDYILLIATENSAGRPEVLSEVNRYPDKVIPLLFEIDIDLRMFSVAVASQNGINFLNFEEGSKELISPRFLGKKAVQNILKRKKYSELQVYKDFLQADLTGLWKGQWGSYTDRWSQGNIVFTLIQWKEEPSKIYRYLHNVFGFIELENALFENASFEGKFTENQLTGKFSVKGIGLQVEAIFFLERTAKDILTGTYEIENYDDGYFELNKAQSWI